MAFQARVRGLEWGLEGNAFEKSGEGEFDPEGLGQAGRWVP
jgi:hypothetical protein